MIFSSAEELYNRVVWQEQIQGSDVIYSFIADYTDGGSSIIKKFVAISVGDLTGRWRPKSKM